jgi:hypothetical protein|tara:strand:- start:52 stop:840 length:789 start_codon:yes stop_codon:yes gene_type:complete
MSKIIVDEIQTNTTNGNVRIKPNGTGVLEVDGSCTATTFSGSGANLTSLPAANLTGTLPALSAANLTSIPAANLTGTLPALSAANLTSIPAANLTGTLPAIDGSNLTNISGGGSAAPPCWYGQGQSGYNISTSSWETITYLTGNSVNPSGNSGGWDSTNGIYTVQSGQAGIYYVFGAVGVDDLDSDDIIRVGVSVNNNNPTYYDQVRSQSSESSGIYGVNTMTIVSLSEADTVRLKVQHYAGTTEQTEGSLIYFGGFRIIAT